MQVLSHSQAHASGDLASAAANAGRIARINESRAIRSSETALFNGALEAIRSVDLTPARVQQLMATINACMDRSPVYATYSAFYPVRLAVLEAFCAVDEEVNPEGEEA